MITPGDILSPGDSIDNSYFVEKYPYTSNSIYLKNLKYVFLEDFSVCEGTQIPQGLCITEKYLLISAYEEEPSKPGYLRVYEKHTGELLLTLLLNSNSHLGGIAFDGENIWISNSNENTIEQLNYEMLEFMLCFQKGKTVDVRNLVEVHPVNCIPSGITYYDGSLWVVTHNIWMDSHMQEYRYDIERNELVWMKQYNIPSRVQGVTFGDKGEVYFSISYGRRNSSYIKTYESLNHLNVNPGNCQKIIEMPPCSEQLWYEDDMLYVLFESASPKYKKGTDGLGKSLCPLDEILVIDLTSP